MKSFSLVYDHDNNNNIATRVSYKDIHYLII